MTTKDALVCALVFSGCTTTSEAPQERAPTASTVATTAPESVGPRSIAFVEDDIEMAFSRASASGKELVVDVWAPWCEACLSLRAEIAKHRELGRHQDRFVFATVDVDRPASAAFMTRYGAHTMPTIMVIDASTREVVALRGGAISIPELEALLEGLEARRSPGRAELVLAHAAAARGDHLAAARSFQSAAGLLGDRSRTEAVLGALTALFNGGDYPGCADLARTSFDSERRGSAAGSIALSMQRCGEGLPAGARRSETLAEAARAVEALVATPPLESTALDQAETLALWAEILQNRGDSEGTARAHAKRLALLEAAAGAALTPEEAQAFDHARVKSYLALHRQDEAVQLLRTRVGELPDRYETHGRLGTTLLELGQPEEAASVLERAVTLAYGPPRLVYLDRLAAAHVAAGRRDAARHALEEEVAGWDALAPAQRDAARMAGARARLEAMKR